ncbi:hypothetical protein GCM10028804_54280 [Larkinella terrae]
MPFGSDRETAFFPGTRINLSLVITPILVMFRFFYTLFFVGVTILGYFLTDYLFKKLGLMVILTPGPYLIGYGLMKVARYRQY